MNKRDEFNGSVLGDIAAGSYLLGGGVFGVFAYAGAVEVGTLIVSVVWAMSALFMVCDCAPDWLEASAGAVVVVLMIGLFLLLGVDAGDVPGSMLFLWSMVAVVGVPASLAWLVDLLAYRRGSL